VRPFFSNKYDITKHKRYVELSDYDEKNLFNVEAFLSTKLRMKKNEMVEVHDMGIITDDAITTS
jgi:type IV secretion system protein VirD4